MSQHRLAFIARGEEKPAREDKESNIRILYIMYMSMCLYVYPSGVLLFVVCRDDAREVAAFLAAGLDADAADMDLIDDDELPVDERAEAKARRAAERHMRARDRIREAGDRKDIWQRLFGNLGSNLQIIIIINYNYYYLFLFLFVIIIVIGIIIIVYYLLLLLLFLDTNLSCRCNIDRDSSICICLFHGYI